MSHHSFNPTTRRLTVSRAAIALAATATCQLGLMTPARAAPLEGEFSGGAASLSAGTVAGDTDLHLGNAAREGCPCLGTGGNTRQESVSNITLGQSGAILSAAVTTATSFGGKTAHAATTSQSAAVSRLSLFGGLITADALKAEASVGATPDTLTTAEDGTLITNLTVAGKAIDPNVANNTVLALPGLGSVTIRAVESGQDKQQAHLSVTMLRIDVTQANTLGLSVGSRIVVAKAAAGYKRTQPQAVLAGDASGLRVSGDAGSALEEVAGVGAGVGLANCAGTGGDTLSKSVANLNVAGLLSVASGTDTAFGGTVGGASVARTTSTLSNVSLLGGLITATGLTAVAQESRTGTTTTPSSAGSGFNQLTVAGLPIAVTVAPNTTLTLPALGHVVLNEQLQPGPNTLKVNALHIVIDSPVNLLGLPVGTQIILGHATAAAKRF